VYTLIGAVLHAQAIGLNPRDIDASMKRLEALAAATKLEACIGTFSDSYTLEASLCDRAGEFKQEVADRLNWKCADTKLFLGGVELIDNSKMLFEYQLSPENCDFQAVCLQDKVEESYKAYQDECAEAAESFTRDTRFVGAVPIRGWHHKVQGSDASTLESWTRELIEQALTRGLVDITAAAELLFQVELGEIAETDARTKVRRLAQAQCSEIDPLGDVDSKCTRIMSKMVKAEKADVERRREDLRPVVRAIEDSRRQSQELAKQLRSWNNDSSQMHGRAIPVRR
jgi:hypothetical protein